MATIGFIGLGVMGEPMCRNLARKIGQPVIAFDLRREPLERLAASGVTTAASAAAVIEQADTILLSLPGEPQVRALCLGSDGSPGGIVARMKRGQTLIDTSTCTVALARELDAACAARAVAFADAPIARTRQAAEDGTLSIMVGASQKLFEALRPLLSHMGSDVSHCGPVGCGQMVKLLNNMLVAENVAALSEAFAIGRRAGMDPKVLFETLAKGSGDSFALRSHGMKAVLPGDFPERAFSTRYMLKDLSYALQLADETGVAAAGALRAKALLEAAIEAGDGENYWPVIVRQVDKR
jgi:3-hydroxyisobutyrate dehydrogenase-like beta-hydroxyacid dehydrogenase